MPKRKKHPRLPSGWGSIRYLGKGRRNPYAVHPPATEQDPKTGHYIQPKAICYVDDWYVGFAVLNSYRAGTYQPGDELKLKEALGAPDRGDQAKQLDVLIERILKDSGKANRAVNELLTGETAAKTLEEVHAEWYEWKCGEFAEKKLSKETIKCYRTYWKLCAPIKDKPITIITTNDIQQLINSNVSKSASTLSGLRTFLSMVFDYAVNREMREKNPVGPVIIPDSAKDSESGVPLTIEEIKKLAELAPQDNYCEIALILCYTGHRVQEMWSAEVDLEKECFVGGVKTAAGKGRIVPIHPYILPLVKKRIAEKGSVLGVKYETVSHALPSHLKKYGLDHHAHDCRHTFSMLCEKYGVPENDRKRLLGHSFKQDVTNAVYGHRSLEDLRNSIEKIPGADSL